jgi:putative ABC transport system permease protein
MKCVGVTPNQVVAVYLGQVLLLALLGSIVGAIAGAAIQMLMPFFAPQLVPPELGNAWQPLAALRGLLMGVSVALVFSVPPLLDVRRVPPVRLLRTDSQPLPMGRWVNLAATALLLIAVFIAASIQGDSRRYGLYFTLGLVVLLAVLAGAAVLVIRLVARLPRDWSGALWLRHGLASLARPGSATISAIVALGLGVGIITAMHLVQHRLAAELSGDLPQNAPTSFFIDIQPDQHAALRQLVERMGGEKFDSVPIVMGRLQSVDGKHVDELAAALDEKPEAQHRKWVLTREQRMTYTPTLAKGNTIVDAPQNAAPGQLWSDPEHAEVSIERQFAADLNVKVGSTITLDVQGVPITLKVTSIRNVDWRTFGINFFLVVEPGVLDDAPQLRLATARIPEGAEQRVQDTIVEKFPNITVVHIRQMLTKVLTVLDRLGLAVQLLGAFTVVSGVVILAGVISASYAQRGREVALLKTLGMTRRQVVLLMGVEYALIGLVAAVIGVAAGATLAWAVLTRVMELPFDAPAGSIVAIVCGAVASAVGAGLAVSVPALQTRPIAVLRQI